jgi:cell wall-associated NlpC family hydrolase
MIETISPDSVITKYLGIPYINEGRDMSGTDCYGLLLMIFKDCGIELPDVYEHYSSDFCFKGKDYFIEQFCNDWVQVEHPIFLDVVGFKTRSGVLNHAGIMLDADSFIHTCKAGTVRSKVAEFVKRYHFGGYYRHKVLA